MKTDTIGSRRMQGDDGLPLLSTCAGSRDAFRCFMDNELNLLVIGRSTFQITAPKWHILKAPDWLNRW
jgi:hypothetical protein